MILKSSVTTKIFNELVRQNPISFMLIQSLDRYLAINKKLFYLIVKSIIYYKEKIKWQIKIQQHLMNIIKKQEK